MARKIKLTLCAEARLADILLWTADRFGPAQAAAYQAELLSRLQQVAGGQLPDRSVQAVAGPLIHPRFRCIRAGEHFAVFLTTPDTVTVIDFLHSRSDLPQRSQSLPDPDEV